MIGNPDYNYDDDTSDEDDNIPVRSSAPVILPTTTVTTATAITTTATATATTRATNSISTSNAPAALQRLPSVSSLSCLSPQIWDVPWVPKIGRYHGLVSAELLAETVYDIAVDNVPIPKLEIRGKDVDALVILFKELLAQAAAQGDFTEILSPDRSFFM